MVWSPTDERFQENLEAAKAYYEEHWTLCAPRAAAALDKPIGQWLSDLRRPGALAEHPEWEAALAAVDEGWNPEWPAEWQRHYAALRELVHNGEGRRRSCPASPCTAWTSARGWPGSGSPRPGRPWPTGSPSAATGLLFSRRRQLPTAHEAKSPRIGIEIPALQRTTA